MRALRPEIPQPDVAGLPGITGNRTPVGSETDVPVTGADRRFATVLLTALDGYGDMSEHLDPEVVRRDMDRVFEEVARIIARYRGFIEDLGEDGIMVLFGVPESHEDDVICAIQVAGEIHDAFDRLTDRYASSLGAYMSLRSGILSGLIATGNPDEESVYAIDEEAEAAVTNLVERAGRGEIWATPDACRMAGVKFNFEPVGIARTAGGKTDVQAYKVLSATNLPGRTWRPVGLQAELIGRRSELDLLQDALVLLKGGMGSIVSVRGEPGTGKSRLIREFRETLDMGEIQWCQGNAYSYAEGIPYFLVIDLLSRLFQFREGDSLEVLKRKLEAGLLQPVDEAGGTLAWLKRLYASTHPQAEEVDPDFWKRRMKDAVREVLFGLAGKGPTVICLEDLHWADASSVELFRSLLVEFVQPVLFICLYRPSFNLFSKQQLDSLGSCQKEIQLENLSAGEACDMMRSLLKGCRVPEELEAYARDRAEGNPFYLEEMVNSLVESEVLVRDNEAWRFSGPVGDVALPTTIQEVVAARVGRLDRGAKSVLRLASVIGRTFSFEVLKKVTDFPALLDRDLEKLEGLGLIRACSPYPGMEYAFKHTLTQEIVYQSIPEEHRRDLHEQVGWGIEQLHQNNHGAVCETLAYHFKHGRSVAKAVDYLRRSSGKSFKRCAADETHRFYEEAYGLLVAQPDRPRAEHLLLVDLINEWASIFFYRGDARGLHDLLEEHMHLALALEDKGRLGMYCNRLGQVLHFRDRPRDAYNYLIRGLNLARETGNRMVCGYTCASLALVCGELGHLEEALSFGDEAEDIGKELASEQYLIHIRGAMGQVHGYRGEIERISEIAHLLMDFGRKHSNRTNLGAGYVYAGRASFCAGDCQEASVFFDRAMEVAVAPFSCQWARVLSAAAAISVGSFEKAENALHEALKFCDGFGCEYFESLANMSLGILLIARGQGQRGLFMLERLLDVTRQREKRVTETELELVLGNLFLQAEPGGNRAQLHLLPAEADGLLPRVSEGRDRAAAHLERAKRLSGEIGARLSHGHACFGLGLLARSMGRLDEARQHLADSAGIFEGQGAKTYLDQARSALAGLAGC